MFYYDDKAREQLFVTGMTYVITYRFPNETDAEEKIVATLPGGYAAQAEQIKQAMQNSNEWWIVKIHRADLEYLGLEA